MDAEYQAEGHDDHGEEVDGRTKARLSQYDDFREKMRGMLPWLESLDIRRLLERAGRLH